MINKSQKTLVTLSTVGEKLIQFLIMETAKD